MDQTIDYYNLNAESFIENTQNVDMHMAKDKFLHLSNEGAAILDFGCGSGRDTKYFLDKGCRVTATDGSAELCKWASDFTGIEVKKMLLGNWMRSIHMMVFGHAPLFCICQRMSCFW